MANQNDKRALEDKIDVSSSACSESVAPKKQRASTADQKHSVIRSSSSTSHLSQAFTCENVVAHARQVTASISKEIDVDKVFADAKVHYLTRDRASWVYHVPRWYHRMYAFCDGNRHGSYREWLDRIWTLHPVDHGTIKMFGRDVLTPRFQQAYGVSYRFSGNTFEAVPVPESLQHCVELMQAMVVNPATDNTLLNGVLLNWYADGDHYIGPHSDSVGALYKHSPVFSLSLGATRRFVFTAKTGKSSTANDRNGAVQRLELALQSGDLIVMGGMTQQTHKHALPKMKNCIEKRVSITLRCFVTPS
uniref:Fe2OG dioxygenase domain-containing protein n=1 Tax=Globisporangium ultimum (strain ATCC 200006 / CBS 805.95 / DAOM BR144) TaxID=431595 RepID=K3WHX5_GLOUD